MGVVKFGLSLMLTNSKPRVEKLAVSGPKYILLLPAYSSSVMGAIYHYAIIGAYFNA